MSIHFDIFLDTLAMCGFHVKVSARITPKMTNWLISRLMSSVCLFWQGLNTIKLICFKLLERLLAWHQSVKLGNSPFKAFYNYIYIFV